MKDLTHYFQSPNKVVNTNISSPEDCVVIEKSPQDPNSIGRNGSVSHYCEKEHKSEHVSEPVEIQTPRSCEPEECQVKESPSKIGNGYKYSKVSGKHPPRTNGIFRGKKRQEDKDRCVESSGKKLKTQSSQNECADSSEECNPSESENTSVDTPRSPNAFLILMSTQQVFSSISSGRRECSDETDENCRLKHENKKKIKDNLEKMAKRKLEMEANIHACENRSQKPSKKRRRIIVESDSDSEATLVVKSNSDLVSEGTLDKQPYKRNKPNPKVTVKGKQKKNDKLGDNAPDLTSRDLKYSSPQKLNSISKRNTECQESDVKKSKNVKIKACSEQNDSKLIVLNEQNDVAMKKKDKMDLQVTSNMTGNKKCGDKDSSTVIVSVDDMSDTSDVTKRKSNILNYFNKVTGDVKNRHSEKIKVTADVHFPVSAEKISKKVVVKRKCKKRRQGEVEDDIQLIDTEMIEKPDDYTEAGKSALVTTFAGRDEHETRIPLADSKRSVKMESASEVSHTPRFKDWKIRIRMSSSSIKRTPSPIKQYKKCDSPLIKTKLKLSSRKQLKSTISDETSVNISYEKDTNEMILLSNTPEAEKEKEKLGSKMKLNFKEERSPGSISLSKKKLSAKTTRGKNESSRGKDDCILEVEKVIVKNKSTPSRKGSISEGKEALDSKKSTKVKNSACQGRSNAIPDDEGSTDVKNSTPKGRRSFVAEKECTPTMKIGTAVSRKSPSIKRPNHEEEQSTPGKTVTISKRKHTFSLEESPPNKSIIKKISLKKTSVKKQSTRKRNLVKNTPKRRIAGDESPAGEEEFSSSQSNHSCEKEEETRASRRARRSCIASSTGNVICSPENTNQVEMTASGGKRRVVSSRTSLNTKESFFSVNEASEIEESFSTPIGLRCSSRNKFACLTPDYGISDEEDEEDFDSDSDDDFLGDSDFGESDEDFIGDCNDYNEDCDEPILVLMKNVKNSKEEKLTSTRRRAVSKEMRAATAFTRKKVVSKLDQMLDQKIVLQFLKNAKGTLNRKMALHDPENFSSAQPGDAEERSAPVKLAPLFVSQKTKKPDKATVMARKTFLQSGVPEVVKKMVEIKKLAEEQEHVEFPTVSHIQQKEDDGTVWNLPDALQKFPSVNLSSVNTPLEMPIGDFTKSDSQCASMYSAARPPRIQLFRDFLRGIKAESPNFPVYRTFRCLFGASRLRQTNCEKGGSAKKGRRRSSLASKKVQESSPQDSEPGNASWAVNYRPLTSSDILGNGYNVSRFKEWLELWVQVKENTFQKNFKEDVSSGDEFLNDESDDESGKKFPKKTAVLMGPTGSGKTMTVYTLAHELGYKVLEVNAASKRTGRRIISELLEATQSHQVHGKGDETTPGIKNFFTSKGKSEKAKSAKKKEIDQQAGKLSLILVEDADIVFEEEDEGFVSALSTLVIRSKRPVVLVTSDPSCSHLSRFLEKSLVLEFKPAACEHICVWLQLVSLLEGVRIQKSCVEELLRYSKGDMRKALLQLQFWVLSGGDNPKLLPESSALSEIQDFPDDISNSSWVSVDDKKVENETNHPFHTQCLSTFLELDPQILLVDRSKLWWNVPKLVGLDEVSHQASRKKKENCGNETKVELSGATDDDTIKDDISLENDDSTKEDNRATRKKWKSVCSAEDVNALVVLSDVLSVVATFSDDMGREPYQCAWEKEPVDSLSLSQDMQPSEYGMKHTTQSIGSWLVSNSISQSSSQLCSEKHASQALVLQQQPPKEETSWKEQQHNASRELEEAVAMLYWPQRGAVAMDYISCLRNISRLEQDRVCVNDKRNNRFFHYLKGLGAHPSPTALDTACDVFKTDKHVAQLKKPD